MCRLFSIVSSKPTSFEHWFFNAKRPIKNFLNHHNDGIGLASYKGNKLEIFKQPGSKKGIKAFDLSKIKETKSKLLMLHLRCSSLGKRSYENTHPFTYKNIAFSHNGSLNRTNAMQNINGKYKKLIKGQTDSEVYFFLLMQNLEKCKNFADAIKETIKTIQKKNYDSLNLIFSDSNNLYALRYVNPKKKKTRGFTLFYIRKNNEIIISSSRLSNENWTRIKNKELVIIKKNLNIKKVKLKI